MAFSLHRFIYWCTLTDSYINPLQFNLFFLIKQKSNENTLHFWIRTPSIKAPHIFSICLRFASAHLSSVDWLGSPPLIASFPLFFDLILPVMQPVQSCRLLLLPQIFLLEKLYCCHLSLALECTFICTHGRAQTHTHTHAHSGLTPDSGLIWSSVFTTAVHLELTLQVANILLRDYLRGFCASGILFPYLSGTLEISIECAIRDGLFILFLS